MTSRPALEATSLSFLPSPANLGVGGHPLWLSCQMRNPFGKMRAFESAAALVLGDDGTFELAMGAVELGLICQDTLVKEPESHDIGFESPVVCGFDSVEEGSVPGGGPLKGFVDPVR